MLMLPPLTTSRPLGGFSCNCNALHVNLQSLTDYKLCLSKPSVHSERCKLFTFNDRIKATLKRKLILTGLLFGNLPMATRGWRFFSANPSRLICFAKCADIAIGVIHHVGNIGVGNVGNFQCGNDSHTPGHCKWFAQLKWGSDTLLLFISSINILILG